MRATGFLGTTIGFSGFGFGSLVRPVVSSEASFRRNQSYTTLQWYPMPQGVEAAPSGGSVIGVFATIFYSSGG